MRPSWSAPQPQARALALAIAQQFNGEIVARLDRAHRGRQAPTSAGRSAYTSLGMSSRPVRPILGARYARDAADAMRSISAARPAPVTVAGPGSPRAGARPFPARSATSPAGPAERAATRQRRVAAPLVVAVDPVSALRIQPRRDCARARGTCHRHTADRPLKRPQSPTLTTTC
jgi:hypothetical protein